MHPQLLGPLHSYGAMIVLGVALGLAASVRRAGRYGVARFDELAVGLLAFGGGILGAVGLYVAIHLRQFVDDPSLLRSPGLVFYGGVAGGAVAAYLYCRAYRVPLAAVADAGAPGLALGHALGRIGCLLGGCCYGRVVDEKFPLAVRLAGEWRHPVQLYEALGLCALSTTLVLLSSRLRPRRGALFLCYLGGYALLRLGTEHLRGDDFERGFVVPGVSTSQALAALALVATAVLFTRIKTIGAR